MKGDEPQVGQRHEDVERKREYYHIIIFLEIIEIIHQLRSGQIKTIMVEHFEKIILNKSGPANKQHSYHSIRRCEAFSTRYSRPF